MAVAHTKTTQSENGTVRVWDLGVRLFHWLFAAGILAELALGFFFPSSQVLHVWIGYALAGLIAYRLIWGFTGSTFARFSAFPPSISAAIVHVSGKHSAGLGHNPLGGLMVYGLLGVGLLMVLTGMATLGGIERLGPLAALFSVQGGEIARFIHTAAAFLLVAMIFAHIGGVAFESRREKQNLARAMVTGNKSAVPDPTPIRQPRVRVAAGALATAALLAFAAIVAVKSLPQPRIPQDAPLTAWIEECGACHTPHHPGLLPAKTWNMVMASLDDHFGEDASLDVKTTESIAKWLATNAAENFDTKAASWFRQPETAEPLRITATARWKDIHEDLPEAVFKRAKVGSPANCGACHGDAVSGRFNRASIAIPPA